MKKTWNKNTGFNKFIAFCLALLLAVVPLLTYVGKKEGAKAATTVSDTEYFNFTPSENDTDVALYEETINGDTVYFMKFNGTDTAPIEQTLSYFAENLSFAAAPTLLEDVDHSYNSNSNSYKAKFSGYDLQYVKLESGGTPNKYEKSVTSTCTVSDGRVVENLQNDYLYGIAVYMKPKVVSTTDSGDNAINSLNEVMGYTLIGVWKFEKISLTAPFWSGDRAGDIKEEVSSRDTAYKSATLSENTDLSGKIHAGTIKYAYIKSDTEPTSEDVADVTNWGESALTISKDSVDADGIYYGCVAYFAYDASGNEGPLTYKFTETPVNLDVTAPVISNLTVKYGASDSWSDIGESDISSDTFTLGSSEKLRISFTIQDIIQGDPTVKLGTTDCTSTSSPSKNGEYVYENVSITTEGTILVTATDAAGNVGSSTYQIYGKEVTFVNMAACFDVTSAKIVGSNNGSQGIDLPADGNSAYINKQWCETNGTPSIQIDMQSDKTTTDVASSGTVDAEYRYKAYYNTETVITGECAYIRPYYHTTIVQSLGSTSQKLENITLVYRKQGDSANTTLNYGSIIYDVDAPTISQAVLQQSTNGGTDWADVDAGNIEGTNADAYYYINPLELTSDTKYRYFVAASDTGESGLADKPILCTGSSYDFLYDNEAYGYVHQIEVSDLATNLTSASPVSVTAADKAGNESTTTYLPRVIKQSETTKITPVLSEKDGDSVNLTEAESFATNETLILTVTVTSSVKITSVDLKATVNGTETGFEASSSNISDACDQKSKLYTAQFTYQIPTDTSINSLIQSGIITVKTENTDYDTRENLRDILYDISAPIIRDEQGNALSTLAGLGWQKEYTLPYEIVSGDTSYESPLANASYTISNAADENANVSSQVIPVDATSHTYVPATALAIPESATTAGTRVVFTAQDTAGNSNQGAEAFIKVDASRPEIGDINVTGYNGSTPIVGYPAISATVSDNLTIQTAVMTITYPNGSTKQVSLSAKEETGLSELLSHQIENGAPDGEYKVTVTAQDMAGNTAQTKVKTFRVDNTIPVVTAQISSGTAGGKSTREDGTDMYYRSDVGVKFTCYDDNIKSITVTDNGKTIDVSWDKAVGQVTISAEGRHVIKINATDMSDNNAEEKQVEFIIDKSVPGISLVLNGLPYSEEYGVVDCMSDSTVAVSVADMTADAGDFHYQVVQTKPDQATTVSQYLTTDARSFTFGEEADYTMNFYAVDMADNQSAIRSVSFRIDKTAPELTISGAASGGTSASAATVSFSMKEAFWKDAGGSITIYRRAGDGSEESVYKTVNIIPTAYETVVTETLTETGVYRMEFKAADRAGHSVSKEQTFTIDREAPVITLTGVNNYDITDKTVELRAEIADDFYNSKTVSIEGTRTDSDGKVTKLSFSSFNQHGNPTVIDESFEHDGIYDITITSKDAAGNSHTGTVHFTVDKTAPKITGLEDFDGAVLNAFDLDFDLDEMVSDLTVCDVHMYLNGSEYDGVSAVEDGSYTLLITAEDELGHYSEMSVSFVLDTRAPVFIVTGVEDGEVKQEAYSIDVSLQLEEDILTSVTLNGEVEVVSNNTAHIDVTKEGNYTLCMRAVDEAGNEAEQTIEFRFGQESHLVLWICIITGIVILAGIIIFIILRRKKKQKE